MVVLQAFIAGSDPEKQFGINGMEIPIAVIDVYQVMWSKNNTICTDVTKNVLLNQFHHESLLRSMILNFKTENNIWTNFLIKWF